MGFHAPQEAARILAEAIDYARQAQLAARAMQCEFVAPGSHHHERSHHAGLGVIEDVAVEHPHAGTIVVPDDEAHCAVDGDVDGVLPFERLAAPVGETTWKKKPCRWKGCAKSKVFVMRPDLCLADVGHERLGVLERDAVDAELERIALVLLSDRAIGVGAFGRKRRDRALDRRAAAASLRARPSSAHGEEILGRAVERAAVAAIEGDPAARPAPCPAGRRGPRARPCARRVPSPGWTTSTGAVSRPPSPPMRVKRVAVERDLEVDGSWPR